MSKLRYMDVKELARDHTEPEFRLRQSGSRTHAPHYHNMLPLQFQKLG